MKRLLAVLAMVLAASAAWAQERRALVIGNDAYTEVEPLQMAVADANSMSRKLEELGFDTIRALNLGRRETNRKISEFTARLEPGDTALVFFAGHGVEIDGENYLLPTDIVAPDRGESDFVKSESIALSDLLDRIRATGARTSLAIIDACRNNPFKTGSGRSIGRTRGLGRIAAPQGTFVIFSAGAGQLALDRLDEGDTAGNSVFTRALLPLLSRPGLELRSMVAALRREVRDLARTVQHNQIPAYYDELLGEFYFAPGDLGQQVALTTPSPPDTMRADLDLARSVGTVAALDAFLDQYADRSDDYGYAVALQLRENLAGQPPAPPDRPAAPDPAPVPVIDDSREVMRQTQTALTDLGCAAGGADGIAGPRTRRAFGDYLAASSSDLGPDDLGTRHALDELTGKSGTICVAAAPVPTRPAPTMAGHWKYKATCALVLKVTGAINYAHAGDSKYSGKLTDSLGQNANSEISLKDRQITGTDYFPGITVHWRGRLSDDGNSYTATGSTGCSVYAWRAG